MAIDKIKKAVFITPQEIYENFLVELKNISCVEIIEQQKQDTYSKLFSVSYEQIKEFTSHLESLLNVLQKYNGIGSFSFTKEKIVFNSDIQSEIKEIKPICDEIVQLHKNINQLTSQTNVIETKLQILSNFHGVDINFSLLTKSKVISYFFIKTDFKTFEKLKEELKKFSFVYYWVHKKVKNDFYTVIFVEKENETKFLEVTKKLDVTIFNLHELLTCESVEKEISKLASELNNINKLKEEYTQKLNNLAKEYYEKIYLIYIKCLELLDFFNVQKNFVSTQYTKIIYCWVPQKFIYKITNLLKKFPEVKTLFFEPEPDDDVPTVLNNKPISEPYEFITTLYGLPKLNGVDPTNFLAPFFTIFFSLCLSDIFYGFLMVFTWILLRKKIPKISEYYKLVTLFKYLGITSIIVGIFLDSFLGFSLFKDFKLPIKTALFDPLNRPIDMLKFTFLLGIIQIIFGLLINTVKNFKDKEILSGIDSLSWAIFIVVFAPIVYKLFFPQDVPQSLINRCSKISLFLFLFIVFFQSRDIKPIFLKPVNFFVKAYNTIGYYADILSYSRILALALASSAIAQTINLLVFKLFKAELLGIKYVEPALAPIVFVGGHIFNFIMSILGGLVHSARLQYLEFFSKFFVSGGRPIKLFQPIRKQMGG
jgi:V/A-type H+-transporting ATPase subunit I